MAYDEFLAERVKRIFKEKNAPFEAKNMMGGLVFMVDDKMCCGIHFSKKNNMDLLMARIGEEASPAALKHPNCKPMDFAGRPMKGYVFITPEGYDSEEDLERWLDLCLAFNPMAKKSKSRKK